MQLAVIFETHRESFGVVRKLGMLVLELPSAVTLHRR
jgi:hypothetical protein